MTPLLLLLLAATVITVGSRVAALTLLPPPPPAVAGVVRRLPAPLFAALAALSLAGAEGGVTDPAMLAATGCALLSTRWSSSLLVTLAAGLGGYLVVNLVR